MTTIKTKSQDQIYKEILNAPEKIRLCLNINGLATKRLTVRVNFFLFP